MTVPIDIFRIDAKGVVWEQSAPTLQAARIRILELAGRSGTDYLLFNQLTGERIIVRFEDVLPVADAANDSTGDGRAA